VNVSGVVDIAIVLTVVYLGLSVVVSQVNEWIATLFSLRGKALYDGIVSLLGDSVTFADGIMKHPLVDSTKTDFQRKPTYIDPRNFSTALWQAVALSRPAPNDQVNQVAIDFAQMTSAPTTAIADLTQAVNNLPVPELRAQLYALLTAAGGDYAKLLDATDAWFNRQMDRVSGWYRRQAQWIVLVITILLTFIVGVDSLRIATRLATDTTLGHRIAARIGAAIPARPAPTSSPPATLLRSDEQQKLLQALDDPAFVSAFVNPPWAESQWLNPWHWFGLIVTTLAVMLGAPFWFDVLQRIANMRLSGPKPDT
jgi:hypothetical protein